VSEAEKKTEAALQILGAMAERVVTDRPIIFSAPMVRGLLREAEHPGAGKRQTRRLLRKQVDLPMTRRPTRFQHVGRALKTGKMVWEAWNDHEPSNCFPVGAHSVTCHLETPAPGDRLWVRESLQCDWMDNLLTGERDTNAAVAYYAADDAECCNRHGFNLAWVWKRGTIPSIHMPREFSRLTLTVSDVRVQRLHEISEEDCWAEGACSFAESLDRPGSWEGLDQSSRRALVRAMYGDARNAYKHIWEHIYGADAWDANPWITALTFTVERRNIDAVDDAPDHVETRAIERAMGI
jgi:hypothetical protein